MQRDMEAILGAADHSGQLTKNYRLNKIVLMARHDFFERVIGYDIKRNVLYLVHCT
jgi:hypothetical protein